SVVFRCVLLLSLVPRQKCVSLSGDADILPARQDQVLGRPLLYSIAVRRGRSRRASGVSISPAKGFSSSCSIRSHNTGSTRAVGGVCSRVDHCDRHDVGGALFLKPPPALAIHGRFCKPAGSDIHHPGSATLRNEHEPRTLVRFRLSVRHLGPFLVLS